MIGKLKEKRYYFLTFFITFLCRMLKIGGSYYMRAASDDIGMLSGAAYFAGYDWSDVVSTTKYYGIGWYVVFAPVLKWVNDPVTVWQIIVVVNVAIVAVACVFAYHIGIRYLGMPNGMTTCLIAIFSSLAVIPDVSMSQEGILYCLTWVIAYFFMKCLQGSESLGKRNLHMFIMVLFCIYAYLIHTRAIVFLVAVFAVLVLVQWMQRKMDWRRFVFFGAVSVVMYCLSNFIKDEIIDSIWGQTGDIMNAEMNISSSVTRILSLKGLRVVFDCIMGNLFTASMKLYGIPCIVIVFMVVLFFRMFKKDKVETESLNKSVLLFFSGMCFIIGLVGVAVMWGKGVVPTYWTDETDVYYKGFIYFRYYATFLGPALFVSLGECFSERKCNDRMHVLAFSLQVFIIFYWLAVVLGRICKSEYVGKSFDIYVQSSYFRGDALNCVLSMEITLLVLGTILFTKRFAKWGLVGAVLFHVMIVKSGFLEKGFVTQPVLSEQANAGYRLIQNMEKEGIVFNDIYSTNVRRSYYLQFFLKDESIKIGVPDTDGKTLVFSPFCSREEELNELSEDYMCIMLDGNEYVWVSDHELYDDILTLLSHDMENGIVQGELNRNKFHYNELETSETGWAMYGPYIRLNPGKYEVMFQMDSYMEGEEKGILGVLDIASDSGINDICNVDWDGGSQFVTLDFQLEELTDGIEFRYFKNAGNDVVPEKVVLSNIVDGEISKKQFIYEKVESEDAGYVMYGPYTSLEPGNYEVTFWMNSVIEGGKALGILEVVSEKGENMICSQNWEGDSRSVTLKFQLEEKTENVEFRYYKKEGNATYPVKVILQEME